QACVCARRGGRVVILGNPSADVTLPSSLISQLMRREVTLYGTWNSEYSVYSPDDDWRTTLQAMASGKLRLQPLITHRVPLDRAVETLRAMREGSSPFCKVLIHPDEQEED
ncbi:MAG: galactitol-1-phosphate 5-dehydrogenase, partial [Armatimonadota bacterium]|nr:galactitol-1-phosphate 5-dehydrogenase [Armatimonadota bacterium]